MGEERSRTEERNGKADGIGRMTWRFSRNTWIAIGGVVIGILFLVGGNILQTAPERDAATETVAYYTEYLEKRVETLCKSVHGVSDATVLLTLEKGSEWVYARNEVGQNAELVILQKSGSEEAVTVAEIYPEIRGVAVVCTGGDDPAIRAALTELLSASLGIPTHRIKIAGM